MNCGRRPNMEKEKRGLPYTCFRIMRWLLWLFYPKMKIEGLENLPDEPCVVVANHTKMNGPICGEIYFPGKRKIWCAHQMMYLREVPDYAFEDFWSKKPKAIRWFYRLLSYAIAPLAVFLMRNANTIPVFRDNRLITTFKKTVSALSEGENVIIFPECYTPHNHIVYQFQDRFTDVAKLYYKRTGKAVNFVPMYIAPPLKKMCIGKPIAFDPNEEMDIQRQKICDYLMDEITEIAVSLPLHRVVPYPNIPKKCYPMNRDEVNKK